MRKRLLLVLAAAALLGVLASTSPAHAGHADVASSIQSDTQVVFDSAGVPFHASLRLPVAGSTGVPAAVIIGGSGDIDRDGNSPAFAARLDPYLWIADQLSAQGVASIRYDKLGTGATGLGPYASDPDALLAKTYDELRVQPARDALELLADQPGIDPTRLIVVGHSEGGMVALALDRSPGNAPEPAGLALLEPQYARILDIISVQLTAVVTSEIQQGSVDPSDGAVLVDWMNRGIVEIRTGTPPFPGPGPDPLPGAAGVTASLQAAIRSSVYGDEPVPMVQTQAVRDLFGQGADALDPVVLAGSVVVPTLITCGTRDVETPCTLGGPPGSGVAALAAALPPSSTQLVVAPGTVHFLRNVGDDDPTTAELADYPYSAEIQRALGSFAASFVTPIPSTPTPPTTPPGAVIATPRFTG